MKHAFGLLSLLTVALSIAILALPPPNLYWSCVFEGCEVSKVKREMSKARVYADVNVFRPKEYWDYESLTVQWG